MLLKKQGYPEEDELVRSFFHGKKLDQNKTAEHKTFGFGSAARQKCY
tara:strand:+ start:556 stop:696 length:141 start_codon:yes stop_codon:yes gene_type:complete